MAGARDTLNSIIANSTNRPGGKPSQKETGLALGPILPVPAPAYPDHVEHIHHTPLHQPLAVQTTRNAETKSTTPKSMDLATDRPGDNISGPEVAGFEDVSTASYGFPEMADGFSDLATLETSYLDNNAPFDYFVSLHLPDSNNDQSQFMLNLGYLDSIS